MSNTAEAAFRIIFQQLNISTKIIVKYIFFTKQKKRIAMVEQLNMYDN